MTQTDYDLITIGGGIAASSLAKVVAEAGHRVLIVERETTFRDRVRGEFMNPWGVAECQALGVCDALQAAGAHDVPKLEFRVGLPSEPRDLVSTSPQHLPAMSFYHPEAQEALLTLAASAGAEVRRGVTASDITPGSPPSVALKDGGERSTVTARLIVGADGRSAPSRRAVGESVRPEREPRLIAGVLLDGVSSPEDTGLFSINLATGRAAFLFPQGGGRVRAYSAFRGEDAERLTGEGAYDRFVEACVATGVAAESYADATPQGPLATFECSTDLVPHPHRNGVALIGDAAATTDPTWGQGLALGFRDARVLSGHLLADDDWQAAGERYADEHDQYVNTIVSVETWMTELLLDSGPEADTRRMRALPLIAADPSRIPQHLTDGPDLPFDDSVRARLFGEA